VDYYTYQRVSSVSDVTPAGAKAKARGNHGRGAARRYAVVSHRFVSLTWSAPPVPSPPLELCASEKDFFSFRLCQHIMCLDILGVRSSDLLSMLVRFRYAAYAPAFRREMITAGQQLASMAAAATGTWSDAIIHNVAGPLKKQPASYGR
jgi:hypothetical protein